MIISQEEFLSKLYIITPFKDKNLNLINQTISKLSCNKTKLTIFHYIIYDSSCKNLINKLIKDFKSHNNQTQYFKTFIQANSYGIYAAINEGLNFIPINSYYMVIGAGDTFLKLTDYIKIPESKIIFFPYKLSSLINEKPTRHIRNIFGGMPFCHNAIAYLNDGSKYNTNYKISADYDHFLKFIIRHKLNRKIMLQSFQDNICIEFESVFGVSSKSHISKYVENIIIIYRYFGILKIFLYFWHTLKRIKKYFEK